jgi:hypothetical protein
MLTLPGLPRAINYGQLVNRACPLNRDLIGWWLTLPQQGKGNTLFDIAGTSHGTLTNGPTWGGALGRPGGFGSIRCASTNDGVNLGTVEPLVSLVAPLTLCGWMRPTSVAGSQNIVAQYFSTSSHQLIKLIRLDGATMAYYCSTAAGDYQGGFNGGTVTAAVWSFCAVVVGGTAASPSGCNLYLATNGANLTATSFSPAAMSATPDTAVEIGLGIRPTVPNSEHLTGALDSWRAYRRALSASEVLGVMQDELRGYPQTLNRVSPLTVFDVGGGAPPATNRRRRVLICGAAA